uniref:Cilia and flagella associated protein 61 n=1 Tax=Hucho hucho TaxID=62062 RepID=A0A4W5MNY7_9TELE
MRTITSSGGKVKTVTVRRTESLDAHEINSLISSATVPVFGRVNPRTHLYSVTKVLTGSYGPYFLAELIEAQGEENHSAMFKVVFLCWSLNLRLCDKHEANVSSRTCIISVPKLAPEFSLLQSFLKVVPHHTSSLPQELYIFHCSDLLNCSPGTVDVDLGNPPHLSDSEGVGLNSVVQLTNNFDFFQDGTPLQVFVAQVPNQLYLVLLKRSLSLDIDYIRANYNIKNVIYFSHHRYEEYGKLSLCPQPHLPSLRQTLPEGGAANSCAHYLTSVLNCMPLEELGINTPSKQTTKDQAPYALNHINRKLTMEPKVTIIVVLGSSDTGFTFFEVLRNSHTCRFNNMTLISTQGFPGYYTNESMRFVHGYCDRDHTPLSLHSWINVVTGKMVGIDRAVQHVLVSGGRKVPYDHLILYTGQQYHVRGKYNTLVYYRGDKQILPRETHSVFNDNFLAVKMCRKILEGMNYHHHSNTIDVYTCAGILLSLGVEGFRIHLPTDEGYSCSPSSCFSNHSVEKALENSGVHVHHNCFLAQMNDGQNPESITFVSFTSDSQPLRLECSLRVDYDAFQSNNNACLVYDGRLVIDTTFHTSDSTIHAVGPLTKFPRHYHSDQWSHSRFNSREVVQELAAILLPFFDLTLESAINPPADLDRLLPSNKQHFSKRYEKNRDQGREILTGRIETGNYFHLHLNQYDIVETITCLSLKSLPVSNYMCLYGKHELLLNHLCSRYDEGLVHDLYR